MQHALALPPACAIGVFKCKATSSGGVTRISNGALQRERAASGYTRGCGAGGALPSFTLGATKSRRGCRRICIGAEYGMCALSNGMCALSNGGRKQARCLFTRSLFRRCVWGSFDGTQGSFDGIQGSIDGMYTSFLGV